MRTYGIAQGKKRAQSVCRTYINLKNAFQHTVGGAAKYCLTHLHELPRIIKFIGRKYMGRCQGRGRAWSRG